ncbi:MAG: flagellar basal body P-ring formation chaperone FlgA [Gammaproteobacteria bacterium]|nr:flagellar basal body P-ring formation chaperone FlgA [Gammaproteobacteria bacterium]
MNRYSNPSPVGPFLFVLWLLFLPTQLKATSLKTGVSQAVQAASEQLSATYLKTNSRTKITVKTPDTRLQLTSCAHTPNAPSPQAPLKFGKVTIKVSCNQPQQWSIYLSAMILQPVIIWSSTQNIPRDTVIGADDIRQSETWLAQPAAGAIQNADQIIGMQSRQLIQSNQVIKDRLLRQPLVIKKGHQLSAQVRQPGFSISAQVIALQDGAKGETIRVENSKTGKLLFARISPRGTLVIE